MANLDDVRRIGAQLPGVTCSEERFGLTMVVKGKAKGLVWSWSERVHPKKPKVINDSVLAIVVRNLTEKDILYESNPELFVTDPHYNGFPAVLVRIEAIGVELLEDLIVEAWRTKAPPNVAREH